MTVKELIEALQKLDGDLTVRVYAPVEREVDGAEVEEADPDDELPMHVVLL